MDEKWLPEVFPYKIAAACKDSESIRDVCYLQLRCIFFPFEFKFSTWIEFESKMPIKKNILRKSEIHSFLQFEYIWYDLKNSIVSFEINHKHSIPHPRSTFMYIEPLGYESSKTNNSNNLSMNKDKTHESHYSHWKYKQWKSLSHPFLLLAIYCSLSFWPIHSCELSTVNSSIQRYF